MARKLLAPKLSVMILLTPDDFARMERLLANLLPQCDAVEEAKVLHLHARLQAIFTAQSTLLSSKDRLTQLQSQKVK